MPKIKTSKKAKTKTASTAKKSADKVSPADISGLGLDELKLPPKEKMFIYWYCNPDSEAFQKQTIAARKAGYGGGNLNTIGYHLRRQPVVAKAIDKILNEKIRIDARELFQQALEMRRARAFFNVADYYSEDGEIKDFQELTLQQLQAIDGIDYKGQKAEQKVFQFADREKSLQEIVSLFNKLNAHNDSDSEFDEEALYEVVRERLTLRIAARKKKDDINQIAGLVEQPSCGAGEIEL